jgi:type VI secretion system protein ImpF
MARDEERPVQQSVLDRLIQNPDAPETFSRSQSVRELKIAVRRDLEWLLNTRSIATKPPEGLTELIASAYMYGLGDVTSMSSDDPKSRARLRRMIEESISGFEPRLTGVQVIDTPAIVEGARQMRFVIQALLKMDPSPERVSFDTVLDLATGQYAVKGEAGA